ncbi:pyridoxamine 5'-phosphate oxidase family protein [Streptomyces sp. NPDC007808]|uniref:pyridoxamine 5'-phosphate oxidase family protein n=1 Tax=Streptomyces sp. NPDC007808 TaxID=3364779 RepID=UPI00368A495E
MSTPFATTLRMAELSGAQALWRLEGRTVGPLVHVRREQAVVRPARHVGENGRLVVRAPAAAAAVPATATYHVDEIHAGAGTVRIHSPHGTLLRVHPGRVTGFRLTPGEA